MTVVLKYDLSGVSITLYLPNTISIWFRKKMTKNLAAWMGLNRKLLQIRTIIKVSLAIDKYRPSNFTERLIFCKWYNHRDSVVIWRPQLKVEQDIPI